MWIGEDRAGALSKERPPGGAAPVDGEEGEEAEEEQEFGGAVCGGVVEVLHLVVEGDGEGAGGAGDVSAEHEDDAEFADGVGEGEDRRGDERGLRERESDSAEDAERRGAEGGGDFKQGGIDGAEAGDERLHGEGKRIENGADDEPGEGEGERMSEDADDEAAWSGERAERDEKIEAEDGGRQDKRERDDGLGERAERAVAGCDPPGDGQGDGEQQRGGSEREAQREPEGLRVHLGQV